MKSLAVLAGGLGTRLQSVISEVPKPMAPVMGYPFLHWLIQGWLNSGHRFDKIVISVGYKSDSIKSYFGEIFQGVPIVYLTERVQLGTGGALINICQHVDGSLCVINGDTWFVPTEGLICIKDTQIPTMLMVLKHIDEVSRYGRVLLNDAGFVTDIESNKAGPGWINGGVYFFNRAAVCKIADAYSEPYYCSLEGKLFANWLSESLLSIRGVKSASRFLDIGVPEDYYSAADFLSDVANQNKLL